MSETDLHSSAKYWGAMPCNGAGTCRLLGKACMTRAVAGQASAGRRQSPVELLCVSDDARSCVEDTLATTLR